MAFINMATELAGIVPKISFDYAKTIVNRAWRDVRRQNLWSFLLYEANWTSPSLITGGTVTTVQGLNTVVFDATASAAIVPIITSGPFPTDLLQRQFRIGVGTIYNIWNSSVDPVTSIVTLTLDRAFAEAGASGQAYMIFQCYYPAPHKDHWQWITVRDMTNWNNLITTCQRSTVDDWDPQRTCYYIPTHVVPYQQNQNRASQLYAFPQFELWGVPQYQLTYQIYALRKGMELVNNNDVLPPEIGEDCVMALSRKYAYEWAEGNKGDTPRNQGSDYRFLIGEAGADYKRLFSEYRRQDRAMVDNFRTKLKRTWAYPNLYGWYSSVAGVASAGAAW